MTKLDLAKPVQTREGDPVRIICTDRKGEYPIIGLITSDNGNGHEDVRAWPIDGQFHSKNMQHLDLINVPQEAVKYYVNVYIAPNGNLYCGRVNEHKPRSTAAANLVKTIEFELP